MVKLNVKLPRLLVCLNARPRLTPSKIRDPSCVATTFFNKVLNKAISSLSITTRTRQHNLSLTSRHYTPEYYRLYPEDISALSMEIKYAIKSLPPDEQFTFYNNLGQQQPLTSPLSIRSLNLDMVISDVNKIEYSCCHIAVNFCHTIPFCGILPRRPSSSVDRKS